MRAGARRPCISCNQGVKFTDLLSLARDLGADCLATGHYVRRVMGPNGAQLHRALDPARDQSYFLFATTREQLDFLRFPLGDLPKPAVREIARELRLAVAEKPDSQDICFVPNGTTPRSSRRCGRRRRSRARSSTSKARCSGATRASSTSRSASAGAGDRGAARSRSTSSGWSRRRRGSWSARARSRCRARLSASTGSARTARGATAKVRSMARPAAASFDGEWLHFEAPEFGVAPGQAAVIYDGSRVLGGGWIEETLALRAETLAAA
jgi:tRNA-specific 2-thiouridylase